MGALGVYQIAAAAHLLRSKDGEDQLGRSSWSQASERALEAQEAQMSRHPVSYDFLVAFAGGELAGPEADTVSAHVAGCPNCAATVARYSAARAAVADAAWEPVPAAAMSEAKGLFARFGPRPAVVERTSPLLTLRRLVATITFDSAAGAGLAGARGAGEAYTLVYSSEVAEIELQVEPSPANAARGEWQIMGQITPREELGAEAPRVGLARPSGEPEEWVTADEHGYFSLVTTPGRYDILIALPDVLLSLPALDVGTVG